MHIFEANSISTLLNCYQSYISKDVKGSQGDFKWVSGDLRGFQGGKFMISPGMGICIF